MNELIAAPAGTGQDRIAPKEDVLDFLNVRSCKIVFRSYAPPQRDKDGTRQLTLDYRLCKFNPSQVLLIDYGESEPDIRSIAEVRAFAPIFSPDGGRMVYNLNFKPTDIFVQRAEAGAEPVRVGFGANPTWWTDPRNGDEYIVFRTECGEYTWPQPGRTLRQRIDPDTSEVMGPPEELLKNGFGGGLTADGRYLATGFLTQDVVDLEMGIHYQHLEGRQSCNVTVAPDATGRIMSLRSPEDFRQPHDYIGTIYPDGTGDMLYARPERTVDWQTPKWSNHPDYAVAVAATPDYVYEIYLIRLSNHQYLKVVSGSGYIHPHLWCG